MLAVGGDDGGNRLLAVLETVHEVDPKSMNGTFPRILAKYVREEKVITLENAVREMTSLPANQLRLLNRGRIAPGMAADLVVFDPQKIQDTATFEKPMSYATGMDDVLVNGKVAIEHDAGTGVLAGVLIRANK